MHTKAYKRGRRPKGSAGFTLSEMLIVMAILSILAIIAVPMFMGQRTKAAQSEAKANLEMIRLLEEQYFADNGRYAPDPDGSAIYNGSSTTLQTVLPGFKPGRAQDLLFNYSVVSSVNGTAFTATAAGKSGTLVEGNSFNIDQDNQRNF